MPYDKLTDLPDSVRNNLAKHAQEIYRAAYNSAEEQYGEEERAHRVAWSAEPRAPSASSADTCGPSRGWRRGGSRPGWGPAP